MCPPALSTSVGLLDPLKEVHDMRKFMASALIALMMVGSGGAVSQRHWPCNGAVINCPRGPGIPR
jgi:hypothetical protein